MTARKSGRAAHRPAPRTVSVSIAEGEFAGWEATARADFPASVLADMQGDDIGKIMAALDRVVITHNLPAEDGEVAARMADVDPYEGALKICEAIFDAIGKLPNR